MILKVFSNLNDFMIIFYLLAHSSLTVVFHALFIKKLEGKTVNLICVSRCSLDQIKFSGGSGDLPLSTLSWENLLDPRMGKTETLRSRGQIKDQTFCIVFICCNLGSHKNREQSWRKGPILQEAMVKRNSCFQSFQFLLLCSRLEQSLVSKLLYSKLGSSKQKLSDTQCPFALTGGESYKAAPPQRSDTVHPVPLRSAGRAHS